MLPSTLMPSPHSDVDDRILRSLRAGELTYGQLRERLRVSGQTLNLAMRRLIDRGLVERLARPGELDRVAFQLVNRP